MVEYSTQTDFGRAYAMTGPDREALSEGLVLLGVLGNASRAAQCGAFSHIEAAGGRLVEPTGQAVRANA